MSEWPVLPRAAVSACLFRGREVLLVKRARPPYAGAWSLPGGSIEPGETAHEAIVREIGEEAGLSCRILGVAGVHDVILRDPAGALTHHYVISVFVGIAGPGRPVAGDDAVEAAFFPHADVERLHLPRATLDLIERSRSMAAAN